MANETTKATAATKPAAAAATAAAPVDPAGAAIADAARKAEVARLTEQRDELRKLVDADSLTVLRAEVNALEQAAARGGISRSTRWTMSAGLASDLEVHGYGVDPTNGDAYVREGDRVKVTARTGETRTVEMPKSASAPVDGEK